MLAGSDGARHTKLQANLSTLPGCQFWFLSILSFIPCISVVKGSNPSVNTDVVGNKTEIGFASDVGNGHLKY